MSRTRRRAELALDINDKVLDKRRWDFEDGRESWETGHQDYYSKRNSKHDKKGWPKPPSFFKKLMNRKRKAQVKQAMRRGNYDTLPLFKKENVWLWA